MSETIQTIIEWHAATFPDANLDGQLEKFLEEEHEWIDSGRTDVLELADMVIAACGICRFSIIAGIAALRQVDGVRVHGGVKPYELDEAVNTKMQINRDRSWCKKGGLYKHKDEG